MAEQGETVEDETRDHHKRERNYDHEEYTRHQQADVINHHA
jgi:hypothetical protein